MSLQGIKAELEARQVFKAWEIEENLDRYFCRPVAVVFTAAFRPLRITPNQVSLAGMLVGMASAAFLFSDSLPLRILSVILLWTSEVLDAADGQLARLQTEPSRYGRIVDGLCSMGVFFVLYTALAVGLQRSSPGWFYPLLATAAILTHSLQSSLYDFYRTEYIRIAKKRQAVDPDSPDALRAAAAGAGPRSRAERLMLSGYIHYASRQMWTTPTYQPLARAIAAHFGSEPVSEDFAAEYARVQRGYVRWWNYLGSNTHLLVLCACILVRRLEWFLWANVVFFNLYAIALALLQGRGAASLQAWLARHPASRARGADVPGVPTASAQ